MAENTDAIAKALQGALRAVRRGDDNVAEAILSDFREVVSVPYPPPSSPGEPPHLRTGRYRAGIKARNMASKIRIETTGFASSVGTWTEFGTRKMAARPHWRTRLPEIVARHLPPKVVEMILRGEGL